MEKHSDGTEKQFSYRLLKAACFFLLILFSETVAAQDSPHMFSRADAEGLMLLPKDEIFFTNKEAQFSLRIPKALPREVQTELPAFPDGVTFGSSRRGDFVDSEGRAGTEIDLWFTFRQTGRITLPPLVLYIQGRRYSIKFKEVEIYENPRTIQPRLLVVFDSGITFSSGQKNIQPIKLPVGKAARFMLYVQYGIQVQHFTWDIPKDSLFREIKRYEITQDFPRSSEFSTRRIPVAYFEWTPLKSGEIQMPEIRMMITAYSGRAVYVALPELTVQVLQKDKAAPAETAKGGVSEDAAQNDFLYGDAFTEPLESALENRKNAADVFDYAEIARLRSEERRSLFKSGRVRAQRISIEQKAGISDARNEESIYLFVLFAALCVILLAAALVLFVLNKKFESVLVLILSLAVISGTVFAAFRTFRKFGIVLGGEISPIPEDSAITKSAVTGGSRVLIKDKISGWYYIEYNENGGWIKEANLVEIK